MDFITLFVLSLGAAAGALVQAATGFGFAIVAAPVFLWAMNSHAALQILVIIHLVQTIVMVPQIWRDVSGRLLAPLLAGALIGSPIGLAVFIALDVRSLKLIVGVLILAATALLIARERGALRPRHAQQPDGREGRGGAFVTGGLSGLLTALLVMPGPPLMLYFASRQPRPAEARALAITFFGLCYLTVTLLNVTWAGMRGNVWSLAAALSPAVLLGTLAGMRLARYMTSGFFRVAVLVLLIASGLGAILSAL